MLSDQDRDVDESTFQGGPDTKLEQTQVTQYLQEGKAFRNFCELRFRDPR